MVSPVRLFTGVAPDSGVTASLTSLIEALRGAAGLRWTAPRNLHITTRFIGNWPDERLSEIDATLREVAMPEPIAIEVRGFGFFPKAGRPHSLYAAVQAGPELAALAGRTDDALARLGLPPGDRPYTPHVTLARIKGQDVGGLQRRLTALEDWHFGKFLAREFHLYRSTPSPEGSIYEKVGTYAVREDKT